MAIYFKGYKFKSLVAVFFKFLEAAFELILPLLMVVLIDDGIILGNQSVVYQMVGWMLVLTLLGYIASITCQYMASVISQKIGGRIRLALFDKISSFSMAEYGLFSESTLANRMSVDVNAIQDMIARTIRLAVRAPMILIGSLFALYQLSPHLAKVLFYFVPLFVVVIVLFMYLSMNYHKRAQKNLDSLSLKSKSLLDGAQIVRAFSREDYEEEIFKTMNDTLAQSQRKVGIVASLSNPFTTLLMNGVLVLLVYFGAVEINAGSMSQGQMVALINYCTQLVLTLIVFMNLVMIFSRGAVSSVRIKEILAINSSLDDCGTGVLEDGPLSVSFDDVSFSYPGERRRVLNHLTVDIEAGMKVGFIGLTGSGKSTILRLLMRFYDVSEGSIQIDGHSIDSISLESLRSRIAYVAQSPQFLEGSLESNVLMDHDGDAELLLGLAQGSDIVSKGLDAPVYARGRNFSGGQRQRISIARALAKPFGLIVFDDSFSALDMLTGSRLRKVMQESYADVTQIVISQRTQAVVEMDRIYVVDKGNIVDVGTHESLLKSSTLYREVYELQSEDAS